MRLNRRLSARSPVEFYGCAALNALARNPELIVRVDPD